MLMTGEYYGCTTHVLDSNGRIFNPKKSAFDSNYRVRGLKQHGRLILWKNVVKLIKTKGFAEGYLAIKTGRHSYTVSYTDVVYPAPFPIRSVTRINSQFVLEHNSIQKPVPTQLITAILNVAEHDPTFAEWVQKAALAETKTLFSMIADVGKNYAIVLFNNGNLYWFRKEETWVAAVLEHGIRRVLCCLKRPDGLVVVGEVKSHMVGFNLNFTAKTATPINITPELEVLLRG